MHVRRVALAAVLTGLAAAMACGGGGGGYTPPGPTPPPSGGGGGGAAATVTIRAGGTVDPKEVRIDMGQTVQFVNEDSRAHQIQSNPHGPHTDCPAVNNVAVLQPGERRTTGSFTQERACGYHDHMLPDTTTLHGTIRVAGASGDPGPVYVKH